MRSERNSFGRFWRLSPADNRRRLISLMLVILIAAGVIGGVVCLTYNWLSGSVFFQVTDIKVAGCNRVSRDAVLALAGVDTRSNLIALNLDRIRQKITANPWIASVRVRRDWPSRLEIFVKERQPVVLISSKNGLRYMDKNGVAFAAAGLNDALDFPTITGMTNIAIAYDRSRTATEKKAPLAEALAKALKFIYYAGHGSPFLLSQNISEMHWNKKGGFILFLADNPFPIYLGGDISRVKYYRLARVLRWLYKKRQFDNIAYIRMGYSDKKILVGKKNAGRG